MDTTKDFRIKIAEKALSELEKLIQAVKIQKRKDYLKEIRNLQSEMQIVKYSYMQPSELLQLESFQNIVTKAKEMRQSLKNAEKDFSWKQADYWLEYLEYLPVLMERGEITKAYEAIRYFSGEIKTRQNLNKLWLCSVDCGFRMDVVTNSEEFKPGRMVVISYLPPRMFENVVSEGMFVDASLDKTGELNIEEIRKISDKLGEVESIILEVLK